MKKINVITFVYLIFFISCSFNNKKTTNISMDFVINPRIYREIDISEESTLKLRVSIKGDYTDTQTVIAQNRVELTFYDIPLNSLIWAEAELFLEEDNILYSGKSNSITVGEGENRLSIKLSKIDGEKEINTLFVSPTENNALPDEQDGSSIHPYSSLVQAINFLSKKNEPESSWSICINGFLNGAQEIPATLTQNNIGTLTLKGVYSYNEEDKKVWEAGIKGKDIIAEDIVTPLTVNTQVPVIISDLQIYSGNQSESEEIVNAGGIFIGEKAHVTMLSGEIAGCQGPATVVVSKEASFIMYDVNIHTNNCNSTIQGCTIYVEGNFTMGGGSITETSFSNADIQNASGVVVAGGNFTMAGGSIYKNDEGGVFVTENGSFTLNKGVIENNSGPGVNVAFGSTFTMNGGKITNNIAEEGAAVKVNGTFNLSGGEILNNKIEDGIQEKNSKGVYLTGTLNLSAAAQIDNSNYVCITNDDEACINLNSTLSNTNVATLYFENPSSYLNRTFINSVNGVSLTDEINKFTVSQEEYKITNDGRLEISS